MGSHYRLKFGIPHSLGTRMKPSSRVVFLWLFQLHVEVDFFYDSLSERRHPLDFHEESCTSKGGYGAGWLSPVKSQ